MIVVMIKHESRRIVRTADLRKYFLTCCFIFIQPGIFMQKLLVNFRKSFYICCRKIFKKAFMQRVSISIKYNSFVFFFNFQFFYSFSNYIEILPTLVLNTLSSHHRDMAISSPKRTWLTVRLMSSDILNMKQTKINNISHISQYCHIYSRNTLVNLILFVVS